MKEVTIKNQRRMIIREATPDDARPLLDFIEYIARESDNVTFGPGEFSLTEEEQRNYLDKTMKSSHNMYIIGTLDSVIAGTASISSRPRPRLKHLGELGISVRKDFWRMGIGEALMRELIAWAKTAGLRKINLEVRTDHPGGIALYRKVGFTDEGVGTRTMYIKGEFIDTIRMGLELNP